MTYDEALKLIRELLELGYAEPHAQAIVQPNDYPRWQVWAEDAKGLWRVFNHPYPVYDEG